ncbi:MAG: hypothetical protein WD226_12605 [Planctomycetota bacterium]
MAEYQAETVVADLPRRSRTDWGAILAGLVLTTALGWFLMLLGSALGFSIADATDVDAMSTGFSVTTALWFVASWLIAYFAGALLTARLLTTGNRALGVMHGMAVWGLGVIATAFLAAQGVQGLLSMGGSVVSAAGGVASGATGAMSGSMNGMMGNGRAQSGQTGQESFVPDRVMATIARQASQLAADALPGSEVSARELREAAQQLDAATLDRVTAALIRGDQEAAKDVLASRTTLTEEEIETIVESTTRETQQMIDTYQTEVREAAQATADYFEGVLWTGFIGAALALVAVLLGGSIGAGTGRKHSDRDLSVHRERV